MSLVGNTPIPVHTQPLAPPFYVNGTIQMSPAGPKHKTASPSDCVLVIFGGNHGSFALPNVADKPLASLKPLIRKFLIEHIRESNPNLSRYQVVADDIDVGPMVLCSDKKLQQFAINIPDLGRDVRKAKERAADKSEIQGIEGKIFLGELHLKVCRACQLIVAGRDFGHKYYAPPIGPVARRLLRQFDSTT